VKKIYASSLFEKDVKEAMLAKLGEIDKSDWIDETRQFCAAALPDAEIKQQIWDKFFGENDLSLTQLKHQMAGFNVRSQAGLLSKYHEEFFSKIAGIYQTKQYKTSEAMFFYLSPSWKSDEKTEELCRGMLAYGEANMSEKNPSFIKKS
jgi:hypothetical protein